jgi:hypothetical protein
MPLLSPPPTRADVDVLIWKAWFSKVQNYVTSFQKELGVPTVKDIPEGTWIIWKDKTGGTIKLYANDGGTIKSVALT